MAFISFTGHSEIRPSSDYLRPGAVRIGSIKAVAMLVRGDNQTAACLFEERAPESGAGPLPSGVVGMVEGVSVVRGYVPGIGFRVGVEKRNMAEGHQVRCRSDLFLFQGICKPSY